MELGGVIRMCVLKNAVILLVLLSAIISPISASGDMSGGGGDMSGSSPDGGGCYADPMTGEITCVDTQGLPVGSTGGESVPASGTTSGGTIIITTSGGYSGGNYPGQQGDPYGGSYVPPITVRRPFTTDPLELGGYKPGVLVAGVAPWPQSEEGGSSTSPPLHPETVEAGTKQAVAGGLAGAAGLAVAGGSLTGAAGLAGATASLATLGPAMPLIGLTIKASVDAGAEAIKYIAALSEARDAEEGAKKQAQKR